jgi:heme-binding NEAT domain protein
MEQDHAAAAAQQDQDRGNHQPGKTSARRLHNHPQSLRPDGQLPKSQLKNN